MATHFLVWDPKLNLHPTKRPPRHNHRGPGAVLIYLLIDPRDGTARYVGVTNDLARRHAEHMQGTQQNSRLRNWVLDLKRVGLAPRMVRVGRTTGAMWQTAERSWIKWLRKNGGCYNIQNGGITCFRQQSAAPKNANPFRNAGAGGAARRKFDRITAWNAYLETGVTPTEPTRRAPELFHQKRAKIGPTGIYRRRVNPG